STFGPIRFRLLSNGAAGDWRPLATLVRLPELKSIECPAGAEGPCTLSGAHLFLLDSVSTTPGFSEPVRVPDGFTGQALAIPHPTEGHIYLKLRDDPAVTSTAVLEVRTPTSQNASPGAGLSSPAAEAGAVPRVSAQRMAS